MVNSNPNSKLKNDWATSNEQNDLNKKDREKKYSGEKTNKKVITITFISLLLDLLAFAMILPLFPSILDYYNKNEGNSNGLYSDLLYWVKIFREYVHAPEKFTTVLFGGILGSLFCFLQFLSSTIIGTLSDTYGRKPMLLLCTIGTAISHALWSQANVFSMFVLARLIGGLSKANVNLCMAILLDSSDAKTKHSVMGLIGLAFSIGFTFGPLGGACFAKVTEASTWGLWGEKPAMFALTMSTMNVILISVFLPETLSKGNKTPAMGISKPLDLISPMRILKFTPVKGLADHQYKLVGELGMTFFLYLFVFSGLEFTLTFLTHDTFGFTSMQQGKMFLVTGLIMGSLQGSVSRKVTPQGAVYLSRASLLFTPLAYAFIANAGRGENAFFISAIISFWTGIVLYALTTAFSVTCITAVLVNNTPDSCRGSLLGCTRSIGALARAIGPLFASTVYWRWGAPVTYSIGALILLIPAYRICKQPLSKRTD